MTMLEEFGGSGRLVIAKMLPNGRIDHSMVQSLDEWHAGQRNPELLRHAYGKELLDILTSDLGLVKADEEGMLRSSIIVMPGEEGVNSAVMRLLGKIAEAVIVRCCNGSVHWNRKWGQVGRRGRRVGTLLDRYIAIGTGLETTRYRYAQKYRPNDPHRDVIWIHRDEVSRELQLLKNGEQAGMSAGIQLKVSMNGMQYVSGDLRRARYEVPVVYFDLSNDFYQVANSAYANDLNLEVGYDFVRGRDIDPALHDQLLSYWGLVDQLVRGRISVSDLMRDDLLADAYKKDTVESDGGIIITL